MPVLDESGDWDFNSEVEVFWRERFADQLESALMRMEEPHNEETRWFNLGMAHAAWIVRYGKDDLGWGE